MSVAVPSTVFFLFPCIILIFLLLFILLCLLVFPLSVWCFFCSFGCFPQFILFPLFLILSPFLLFWSSLLLLHLSRVVASSFLPLRFFLCPSCRLFWLVSFGCGFNFSFGCLSPDPSFFSVLAPLLSLVPLFFFAGSSLFFSGFFYSSFIFCRSFCRFCPLAASFFSVSAPLLSMVPPVFSLGSSTPASSAVVPSVASLPLASSVSFALFCTYDSSFLGWRFVCSGLFSGIGEAETGTSNPNIVEFPGIPGASFLSLISFCLETATFFFYDWKVCLAFGESGL